MYLMDNLIDSVLATSLYEGCGIMTSNERKKITANEMYLNQCVAILDGKVKAVGFGFFDENGAVKPISKFNIESYNHGTITCAIKGPVIRVLWDGTDFCPMFETLNDTDFRYKLKPLGIEYYYTERMLGEDDAPVYEKTIGRQVGDCKEYYRFLLCGTMTILLEYGAMDENGKTVVINEKTKGYSDKELIEYMQEQMQIADEIERERFSSQPISERAREVYEELSAAQSMEDFVEDHPILSEDFTQEELDEIDIFVDEKQMSDYLEINYSLDGIFPVEEFEDVPYCMDGYPAKIEEFDYQKFCRGIESGVDENAEVIYSTEDSNSDLVEEYEGYIGEEDEPEGDDYEDDEGYDDGEYDEEEGTYAETTEIDSDEFIMDDSNFIVTRNGEVIEGDKRADIIDEVSEAVMDINNESLTLRDIHYSFMSELRKMRAIIIKRHELLVKRKADLSGADVPDPDDDGDIDL